jgi:hypothetical protein
LIVCTRHVSEATAFANAEVGSRIAMALRVNKSIACDARASCFSHIDDSSQSRAGAASMSFRDVLQAPDLEHRP